MEREGEGKGRRGGEMRKGIIVGGIILSLLLGCNNGVGELEKKNQFLNSVVNLGNDFLNVFTSFGDMISGKTLGFKTDSKKSEVRDYFNKVHEKVEGTKTALNKIVENMKAENNPNAVGVETAVKVLISDKLEKIMEGAKTASAAIGDTGAELLGNIDAVSGSAKGAQGSQIVELIKGIQTIVDIVLKNEGNSEAGDDNQADTLTTRGATAGEAGKLFGNSAGHAGGNAEKVAADAAKSVASVTGADILKAMIKESGESAKLVNTSPNSAVSGITSPKDATIAGAIALRAMAKGGKFANGNTGKDISTVIKGVAVSAVTKALNALTIAIRKTIDEGLKEVKKAMNINANDSPVTTETSAAK